MAIVEMQKLGICAYQKKRKAILEKLQLLGVMQVDNSFLQDKDLKNMDTRTAIAAFEKNADTLDDALKILGSYASVPKSGGLFAEPDEISQETFDGIVESQARIMRQAMSIEEDQKSITECQAAIIKDENHLTALLPWMNVDIPMETSQTRSTSVYIGGAAGTLTEAQVLAAATKDMESPAVEVTMLGGDSAGTRVAVVCLKKDAEKVEANLRQAGFARPAGEYKGIPSQTAAALNANIEAQKQKIRQISDRIASKGDLTDEFRIASDYYRTRAEKYRVLGTIPQSRNMFFLEGWVEASKADAVKKLLEDKYGALVEKEEKRSQEMEPTLLENNRFSRNAEGVLESYGLPQHGRADPTFVMSIFYVFFFGMMLSDAGYGLVMAVACAIILRRHPRLKDGTQKMLRLFFWCGLSTVFWGIMYGSFFGDAVDVIATTFFGYTGDKIVKPLWFEPMGEPMKLLVYCMLFGIIHLYAGLAIKGYELLKGGDVIGFIADILAWYMLITGLILILLPSSLFASLSGSAVALPAWALSMGKYMAIGGAVIILMFSGRDHKNWAVRIALGAYSLYGITSWLSDVLSYSRLLALGLATGVIASVINMMAAMGGNSVGGVILFFVVFLVGHTLNIAINALGAYVHTNRLQYVEFFGKFYDAGGRKFEPFSTVSHYVQIKEEK